jgi:pyruvate/2-oxoglutarate dehydrogenase complex dihydrolipoamide dehydrogenase (E3) component
LADWLYPDLCIIGAGAGGIAAAERAVRLGARVVLIERHRFGGDTLTLGAVPALGLIEAANRAESVREAGSFGIETESPRPVWRKVHGRVDALIAATAPQLAEPRLNALGVTTLKGEARFIDKRTLLVGETHIRPAATLIATGTESVVPPLEGLNDVPYFTLDTILDNTRKLTHLLIAGATPRSLELAQAYRRLGAEVTLVDPAPRLLPQADADLMAPILARLEREGVRLRPATALVELKARSMGIGARVRHAEGDDLLDISHLLLVTERRPRLDGLGLELAGVQRLKADPSRLRLTAAGRTTNGRIYAVAATDQVGTVAAAVTEAAFLADRILFGVAARPDLAAVPRLMRTDPALAEVGLSETDLRRMKGRRGYEVIRIGYGENDRARAGLRADGQLRVLITPDEHILGAAVVGPEAGELIALFALAISKSMRLADLGHLALPYGTHAALVQGLVHRRLDARVRPILERWVALRRQIRRVMDKSGQRNA